jgi:hypothetical protein
MRPRIGWGPVRLLAPMLSEGKPTLPELFAMAKDFGVDTIELHHAMIPAYDRRTLDEIARFFNAMAYACPCSHAPRISLTPTQKRGSVNLTK